MTKNVNKDRADNGGTSKHAAAAALDDDYNDRDAENGD